MTMISHVSDSPVTKTEKNHLLAKCGFCKKDMMLVKGSILVGNKWYHHDCFTHQDFASTDPISINDCALQHNIKNNEVEQNGT